MPAHQHGGEGRRVETAGHLEGLVDLPTPLGMRTRPVAGERQATEGDRPYGAVVVSERGEGLLQQCDGAVAHVEADAQLPAEADGGLGQRLGPTDGRASSAASMNADLAASS